ncbi:short-chain dehydrogenase TIC 32 B, chloroplastic-like [Hibiscus syriacus]|uniref:short-chain dehydrogenase TIC 32 B, chloroplastic-like n=1 Tax=Hibiscus syriacus TaxID=106335 RepID=UPI001921F010|nr:short-chain dehydrogenase TIC 32 B, chloroplastic-like [Hibiscus syriacus]
MSGFISLVTGWPGPSGFGSGSTAEEVTQGIDGTNLIAIITGGASGIGLETSRVLALRGVHVIIGARNLKAANEAKKIILAETATARVDVLELNLCSIKSIRAFADNFMALNIPLNILINNAGIMFCPFHLSQDGIEAQFATNHIGHFLLTELLLDKMKNTVKASGIQGRIVNLSSIAHTHCYKNGIQFDQINSKQGYNDKRAYGQSKLANILHANELSRRLQEEGVNITVNSVHPGLIMTPLFKHTAILMNNDFHITNSVRKPCFPFHPLFPNLHVFVAGFFKFFSFFLWKNVPQGAATTCYVALHPRLKGVTGKYFIDCNEMTPSSYARDEALARELWDFSHKLINSVSK